MNTVRTRYMVNNIAEAVSFYTKHLGFQANEEFPPSPNFAMISRGNFVMVLSTPFGPGGAAKPMLDGRRAEPGGWNRIIISVDDLRGEIRTTAQGTGTFPEGCSDRPRRIGSR